MSQESAFENLTEIKEIKLPVEYGALLDVPVYETHRRGKNWAATVKKNPRSPGGLERKFWERARGEYIYIVPEDISVGDFVEFGADYYTVSGRKDPSRWYGVVSEIGENYLSLIKVSMEDVK